MEDHLNALDATFLELEEADDSAHMHIGAVMIFEPWGDGGSPPLERIRAELAARVAELPRYRQRLSHPHTGGLHWPRWAEDESFDVARHVTRAGLPPPGDEGELLHWAGEYFSLRLDRSHPLWETVIIDLADGRWAMVTKTHHCMVDGVGSVDVAQTLLDSSPDAESHTNGDGNAPKGMPSSAAPAASPPLLPLRLAAGAVGAALEAAGDAFHAAANGLRAGLGAIDAPLRHPNRALEALSRARALVSVLVKDEVIAAPLTSLNDPIGTRRSLQVLTVPLADLKEIKRALGGTVNDAVLAAAAGGFRELLIARGEEPPVRGLRAMVPVNIRAASERLALGNRITSLFVHLPVDEADALDRYRRQVEEAEGLKSGTQAIGSRAIVDLASHAPPVVHSFLAQSLFATRLFNVTITNIPGPQFPLYAFGSRMLAAWPLVPLAASHAVGLAVFSYDGQLFFCLNADRDSMPDLDLLASSISRSIDELRELAAIKTRAEQHAAATSGET
jgi:diacylglycerol O-acyltransferase